MEVYLNKLFFSVNNCEWRHVKNWFLLEENSGKNIIISKEMTFDETYDYLTKNYIPNFSVDESFFRHKKFILVWDDYGCQKYKNFSTFKFKLTKEKFDSLDLNYILSYFPAKLTIKYLIDHGISIGGDE